MTETVSRTNKPPIASTISCLTIIAAKEDKEPVSPKIFAVAHYTRETKTDTARKLQSPGIVFVNIQNNISYYITYKGK